MPINVVELNLDPETEQALYEQVAYELQLAIEDHTVLEDGVWAEYRRAYKAKPKHAVKNFPWANSSNVVIPLVAITVDAIVARFMKTILNLKEYFQVEIKSPAWEPLEKDFRDWATHFVKTSGARDKLRTIFHDCTLMGDAYCKPMWVEESKTYHKWESGQVVEVPVPLYTGVRWNVPAPDDLILPSGFDEFKQLPWHAERQRYVYYELDKLRKEGFFNENVLGLKSKAKERDDRRNRVTQETTGQGSARSPQIFDVYEVWGIWEIPKVVEGKRPVRITVGEETADNETEYVECILSVSLDGKCFLRTIENPFFGKQRFHVKIPYLVQAHELRAQGVGEQSIPFQEEVSTSHNQVIDAGTAANAAIIVTSPQTNVGNNEEIYPGKRIITDNPKEDVQVLHLGADSGVLGAMEEKGIRYNEVRTGVSAYHLGQESAAVGSQATATGTMALLGEGNLRFAVSIDDMRDAICQIMYLTIQLEQQARPEGYEWAPGRKIQFPQGDVRTSVGLSFNVTSDQINKDVEIQQLQLLIQTVNEYYARVMQAAAIIQNPMFPPLQKMMAIQVMDASQNLIKRFVERFDVENTDQLVPNLLQTLTSAMGALSGLAQQGAINAPSPVPAPGAVPPGPAGPGQGGVPQIPPPGAGGQPSPSPDDRIGI